MGYLKENEVRSLVFELQKNFPGCEIVFDVINSYYVEKKVQDKIKKKFETKITLDKDVNYYFGIKKSNELMTWGKGIIFLDETSIYDQPHDKIKYYIYNRIYEHFRKTIFIVHYKLN